MKKINMDWNELATTFLGSLIICWCIFEPNFEQDRTELYWKYQKIKRHAERYYHSAEELYDIAYNMRLLRITRTTNWDIALFVSATNNLLAPYMMDEEGKITALPLRKDGIMGPTLRKPMSAHVIKWD